jgi:DNA invertase Pin-like site-specific DNA recombinase
MTKAYSYIRMSSGRQLKGDSLRRQLGLSEAFAAEHDLELDTSLRDLGISAFDGSNRERGALAVFLAKVRGGEIERGSYLLVENLDRLSRDKVMVALQVFIEILQAGVIIATVADGRVFSEAGVNGDWTQLIMSLAVMSRAHEESARKALNLREAWVGKRAVSERKLTARAPSWLMLSEDRTTFIVDEDRKKIVVRIFEELAAGIGRDKIARRLNKEGIKPWGSGREWHGGTVQKVTDGEAVIGRFQPCRIETSIVEGRKRIRRVPVGDPIETYYPRIVPDDLWMRARRASDLRARSGPGNSGGRKGTVFSNLLSGLARCGACGSPMNYRDRGPRSVPAFRCSGERNGTCENTTKIRYPELEAEVIRWAVFHEPAPPRVDDAAVEALAGAERELANLRAIVERLVVAIEQGAPLDGRLAERHAEIARVEKEVAEARKAISLSRGATSPSDRKGLVLAVREAGALPVMPRPLATTKPVTGAHSAGSRSAAK